MTRPDDEDVIQQTESTDETASQHLQIHVRRKLPGRRLDKYLHGRLNNLSRTAVQRLIKEGAVKVNGQETKPSYEMAGGDCIDITLPAPTPRELVAENIPLDVLYEDEHLIAINKRAGIICHPARGDQSGTIANALMYYLQNRISFGDDPTRPGIVHRLDKNTTGVMVCAKQDEAHWRLSLQFERRTVQKTYLAVVEGELALDSDVIDMPIGDHPVVREKFAVMVIQNRINLARPAVTSYQVAERFRGYSLVRLMPKTGRTHQLRVHMSYLGHPVCGDTLYGGRPVSEHSIAGKGSAEPFLSYQALHAWKINFRHPIHGQEIEIEAPFRDEFRKLVELLREHRPAAPGGPRKRGRAS